MAPKMVISRVICLLSNVDSYVALGTEARM